MPASRSPRSVPERRIIFAMGCTVSLAQRLSRCVLEAHSSCEFVNGKKPLLRRIQDLTSADRLLRGGAISSLKKSL